MSSIRAYRFVLRPKTRQQRRLAVWSSQLRWIWNTALRAQKQRHEAGEPYAGYVQMCRWLTQWRNAPETAWLSEGPIHPQQQVLKRLDESYKRFFKAVREGKTKTIKPPKFKPYGFNPGLRFPDPLQIKVDQPTGRVFLPKIGWIRLRLSQEVQGSLRNASVRHDGRHWTISLQVEVTSVAQSLDVAPTLGIDMGLANFATLSDGVQIKPLKALASQDRRLRRYHRSVSRKLKGSANRRKAVNRLGRLHRRIAQQRSDWLHKLTTGLASAHPVIAIEDLQVANMSRSARGTKASPGKRASQKAGLNRSILDAAWGEFRRQLDYKLQRHGGAMLAVPPAYTSQTCRRCGFFHADNRPSQARFACMACGHKEHADVNAAQVILAAGHAVWQKGLAPTAQACGEDVSRARPARVRRAASVKQEPTEARAGPLASSVQQESRSL